MHGHDSHNPPLLYNKKIKDVNELFDDIRNSLNQIRQETLEEMEEKHKDIFDWLLGTNGDFPDLSQKPHYKFRTELRERLSKLKSKNI